MKNILDLNYIEAKKFLLKEKSYCNLNLPLYFKFSKLLENISDILTNKKLINFYKNGKNNRPSSFEDVNYKLFGNKDGEYAWRLYQLIHPALYVSLVHQITKKENWVIIVEKFQEFKNSVVECESLPVVKEKQVTCDRLPGFEESEKNNTKEQIFHWKNKVEQESIILALEYNYIFHTDIVDCYGSIYTHSIAWALHTKKEAKKINNRFDSSRIGVCIDKHLQAMANGQTNGIPQGSIVMDFIAEMVLGYADQELSEKISKIESDKYKIIRYRDDYRIFVNDLEIGKSIIKELAKSLSEIGMRLNSQKTTNSNDIINSSIKPDRLFWIENKTYSRNSQEQLLILHQLSKKYPNSGTLLKELNNFSKRTIKPTGKIEPLISILMSIVFRNPRIYPAASNILSKFLNLLTEDKKIRILKKIQTRFEKLPNTEYLDLWLQRITLKIPNFEYEHESKLCKKVSDDSVEIWNSNWLETKFKEKIFETGIIDEKEIEKMEPVISSEETDIFGIGDSYY